ncbi:MAG: 30S ribosomal protein S6 [Phycisphaerales bacterium]
MSDTTTADAVRTRLYEGMFLFPQSAAADLGGAVEHVREILARGGAEIVSLVKWDERRLAYDIAGNKRGLYLLAYFRAPVNALARIERDCNLSEKLLRSLVLKAEHMLPEHMQNEEGQKRLADEIALRGERALAEAAEQADAEDRIEEDDSGK